MPSFKLDSESVTGAVVLAIVSIIAILCLSFTLLHMIFAFAVPSYAKRMSNPQERNFITSPLGFYIICLFLSNFICAIGGAMELQWAGPRAISEGPTCTMQAFLLQLGNNASALWLAVLSISALRTFMLRARPWRKMVTLPLIAVLWVIMIGFDAAASTLFHNKSSGFFYGVTGIWCWITPKYRTERLVLQYGWMWLWSFVSALCFLFVFLAVRGNIVVKKDATGRSFRWRKRTFDSYTLGNGEEHYGMLVGTVGKTMAWFPVVYITLTMPLAIIGVLGTYAFPVPVYVTTIAAAIFSLLGPANAVLYLAIRHSLKHATPHISSETTLRGSYGPKSPTDSFVTPQEKRPSPVSRFQPYPWTPSSGPTTKEWLPPSPHRSEKSSKTASTIAVRARPLPELPPPERPPHPSHRPMLSTSSAASAATVVASAGRLSPVEETDSPVVGRLGVPHIAVPPAALLPGSTNSAAVSVNIMSPDDTDKMMFNVPLTPTIPSRNRQGSEGSIYSDHSGYTGPRAITPDMNALVESTRLTPTTPTGPFPPPRKTRRSPIPSVPVDVDESDQGSVCASARPSVETFSQDDIQPDRPMSVGDVATRNPRRVVDSMRSFWAAYEDSSPLTPNMPPLPADAQTIRSRDTMRTFWAAYGDHSPEAASFPQSLRRPPTMQSMADSLASPPPLRAMPSTQSLNQTHFSTVGTGSVPRIVKDDLMSPTTPSSSSHSPLRTEHRRSRSFTAGMRPPRPPVGFSLTPSVSRQSSAKASTGHGLASASVSRQTSANAVSTKSTLAAPTLPLSTHRRTPTPTRVLPPAKEGYL